MVECALPGPSTPVILGLDFVRVESKTTTQKLGDDPKGHQFCSRSTRNAVFSISTLSSFERAKLQNFLTNKFNKNKTAKLGVTHLVQHHIEVSDETSVGCKPYRRSLPVMQALHEKVDELLMKGYIRPSDSSWACLLVIVPKKNNTWRMCIDYRPLNRKTRKSAYPLPIIHRILSSLRGKKSYFHD